MRMSFKDFLIEIEQNFSFDPDKESPEELAKRVKIARKIAVSSPQRAIRARQQTIKDKSAELKQATDDPLAQERLAIKNMEERIIKMKLQLARKEQLT